MPASPPAPSRSQPVCRVLTAGALTLVASAGVACSGPVEPEFQRVERVRVAGLGPDGMLRLNADAIFLNPNRFPLEATALDLRVEVNRKPAAHVRQALAARMPAAGEFTLPLEIDVEPGVLSTGSGSLLETLRQARRASVVMEGSLEVTAAGVRFRVPVRHEREHDLAR